MIQNYFKIAWRNLWRNKLFTLISIIGLSIGITSCLLLFTFIKYELTFDSFHLQSDRIYRVVQHTQFSEGMEYWNHTAYPLAEALRNDFPELEMVAQISGPAKRLLSIKAEDGSISRFEEDQVLFADSFYLKNFDFKWIAGNTHTAFTQPNSVILTESLVSKFFGEGRLETDEVLDKSIFLNNKDELIITGIVADPPGNTSFPYKLLIPYAFFKTHHEYAANNWSGNYQGTTFVILPKNYPVSAFEKSLAQWKRKYLHPEDDQMIAYFLQPLEAIHNESLYGSAVGSYTIPKKMLWGAGAIAIFILLIACTNYVNMSTVLLTTRCKEVGIRKVMGSNRKQLIYQFFGENALLVFFAVIFSLVLVHSLISLLNKALYIIHLQLVYEPEVILAGCIIGIVATVLAGAYPAFTLSAFQPITALKNKSGGKLAKGLSLRSVLTVLQFTIVTVLITATLVVNEQMGFIKEKPLVFNQKAIITTSIPNQKKRETFKNLLSSNTHIQSISFNSDPPTTTDRQLGTNYRLPHQSEEQGQHAEMKGVDEHYLDFYNLQLIAGRNFIKSKERFDEFIVNETLIKAFGWQPEEALGKKLVINEGEATIVGVIKDFHNNSLQEEISPCVLINWNLWFDRASIQLNSTNNLSMSQALAFIEKEWKETFPEWIYKYEFLEEHLAKNYAVEALIFQGFKMSAIMAIMIGCLGLIGLSTFITVQRTKEIGLRKVLGASVAGILFLLSKDYIKLVLIAFLMAVPIANYFISELLKEFAYRIELQWWLFALPGVVVLSIALLAVTGQSFKAAKANPVDSLRSE
ncbi:MAG: ABC transporter permease [Bacteroidota bacterium]